jgi:hypothetical protein
MRLSTVRRSDRVCHPSHGHGQGFIVERIIINERGPHIVEYISDELEQPDRRLIVVLGRHDVVRPEAHRGRVASAHTERRTGPEAVRRTTRARNGQLTPGRDPQGNDVIIQITQEKTVVTAIDLKPAPQLSIASITPLGGTCNATAASAPKP